MMLGKLQKKLKGRRPLRAVLLVLFSVLLTTGAVIGQQNITANLTNTGAPGSTTVSSIKNFGGGNFVSDYA